jgi:hypothetical protein
MVPVREGACAARVPVRVTARRRARMKFIGRTTG